MLSIAMTRPLARRLVNLGAVLVVTSACGPSRNAAPMSVEARQPPGTWAGTLPCADCAGIHTRIDLRSDSTARITRIYRGVERADSVFASFGHWKKVDPDRVAIHTGGRAGDILYVRSTSAGLRLLDLRARPIASERNDLLASIDRPMPDVDYPITGWFAYFADAGLFTECVTGNRYPVLTEGANADLERAYLSARSKPAAAVPVRITGRIVERPRMEGEGVREFIRVSAFDRVIPEPECRHRPDTPLTDTYWKLIRLGDKAAVLPGDRREPHILFQADGRLRGHGGCNRFTGAWKTEDGNLTLGPIAATRMACPEGGDQEAAFLQTLESVTHAVIFGESLFLFDNGAEVAAFQAVWFD